MKNTVMKVIEKKKKLLLSGFIGLFAAWGFSATAGKPTEVVTVSRTVQKAAKDSVHDYISDVYKQIQFEKGDSLDYGIFQKAMTGYMNLRNAGKLNKDKQVLTIIDFTKSSAENRLWIIDLEKKSVLFHTYVAHGQGSGSEFATHFSNENNSHQSSIGFYVTGDTYLGGHGTSLRLNGMDKGYNSKALERGVVMHAADYVSKEFVSSRNRLGRSWGCPAVAPKFNLPIINAIKGGTCMFIYYPEKKYLETAVWLKHTDGVQEGIPENATNNTNVTPPQHGLVTQ